MIELNKATFSENFPWFESKLDESFSIKIGDGISKVIFGFNGIGKSTICKMIDKLNDGTIEFLNYTEHLNGFVEGNGNSLIISTNIKSINEKENELASLRAKVIGLELLKQSNISTSKYGKEVHLKFGDIAKKTYYIKNFLSTEKEFDYFISKYSSVNFANLFKYWTKVRIVADAASEIKNEKDHKKFNAYSLANLLVGETDNVCPICDQEKDKIKEYINDKMKLIEGAKSDLIISFETDGLSIDIKSIDELVNCCSDLSSDFNLMHDIAITQGNKTNWSNLKSIFDNIEKIENEITLLSSERDLRYTNLSKEKEGLMKDFERYFKVAADSIDFDDKEKLVRIKLPRSPTEYSTGEVNLMYFLFQIYSFIGSDKETLVLDDPVSSLDLINQYKIAYEIVRNANKKSMIVFTHSTNLVNIMNSQQKGYFKYFYLEECNSRIFIDEINPNPGDANLITLNQINNNPFIGALIDREINDTSKFLPAFHYTDKPQSMTLDNSLSNYDFINLIEKFKSFTKSDFYTNSFVKIKYMVALRIWLEKKLFKLIPASNSSDRKLFLSKPTIGDKIAMIFPIGANPYKIKNISRSDIMCKKVMLNQSEHYYSQIMPMEYAINLSFDQIKEEIESLKELFK